jgi:hypothetical protein
VLEALARAPTPISLTLLTRQLTPPFRVKGPLAEAMQALEASGQIHRWQSGKTPKYWDREPASTIAAELRRALTENPQAASALAKGAGLKGLGLTATAINDQLKRLAARGEKVYLHPPATGATLRWASSPPKPEALLPKTAKAYHDEYNLQKNRGVTPAQLAQAASAVFAQGKGKGKDAGGAEKPSPSDPLKEDPPQLPDHLSDLSRRLFGIMRFTPNGTPIPLPDLRRLGYYQKGDFDPAILALQDAGLIYLNALPSPYSISESERFDCVTDKKGGFYFNAVVKIP